MSNWQPNLYLTFGKERTQPSIDLVTKIDHSNPKRIIDIGCGPGNSTNVLKARWEQAEITGLDSSESMIGEAKSKYPGMNWLCADASGDLTGLGLFDVVFSNAAIQWIPNQESLLPKLFGMLNRGGILAVQVPCTKYMPIHTELEKLTSTDQWKPHFSNMASTYSVHTVDFYYDLLCRLTPDIDLWETNYFHIMNTYSDIVKWYSGSGLRPYLDCLTDAKINAEFVKEYENALKDTYPIQADGRILFPFTRIFFIAKKSKI
ncbi:MAG: methyltransferase domain-containing protein [Firmicutes bacterium]|nr:methyltransferase domain-containing protein [Bacillota bacterium]